MRVLRKAERDTAFVEFVRSRRGQLVASARLLTAGNVHEAEDLVQTALVRVYLRWGRIRSDPMAYARRALVTCFIDHRRKPAVRREDPTDQLPDTTAVEASGALDPELVAALAQLPPRMRAAVVLRHVNDLPVDTVAELLGCGAGTVKSQTARGLEKLRASLTTNPPVEPGVKR